jgi:hypothetical protein
LTGLPIKTGASQVFIDLTVTIVIFVIADIGGPGNGTDTFSTPDTASSL